MKNFNNKFKAKMIQLDNRLNVVAESTLFALATLFIASALF